MSKRAIYQYILFGFIAISILSCSKFRKIEKSDDWRVKYEAAIQYYEKEDYYRASLLFEQIKPIIRGLPEGEKVEFYLGYCHYNQEYYLLASHQFKQFYETYARSEYALEAQYMYAYSLYANSPSYNLDQTSSYEAIAAMQTFINRYPTSKFRDDATKVIDELQQKLEKKGYENAKQYFKMERYSAAIVAFETFVNDFPDSEFKEEVSYLKFVAQYNYADRSIQSKQLERFRKANDYYLAFIDAYPESDYIKEAEKKYGTSLQKVSELAKR